MKKNLLLLFLFATGLIAKAQTPITITGADLPQAGDHFLLGNDTMPAISLGTPGSSPQNWNFGLIANHYLKAATYDSSSNTPYAPLFSTSNISTFGPSEYFGALFGGAPVGSGYDGYMYWSSDSNGLKVIGWEAIDGAYAGIPIHTNPNELLIGTPATMGTLFNNTSRWDLFLGVNPADYDTTWVATRIKSLEVDAWGSMSTPFGSFPDIIRIHETVVEIDSAIATYNGFPVTAAEAFRDTLNNYLFMANGIGYPLAIVHADKNNVIKDIEYLFDTTCSVYTAIFGVIKDEAGSLITSGNAYLFSYVDSLTPMAIVDTVIIDSSGYFNFFNVPAGYYLISAEANITACSTCIPTYFGDANSWNNGTWLLTLCQNDIIANINLTQASPMTGNGLCTGKIQLGLGKTAGDPVPGLDVSIEQVPGGLVRASTTTDLAGNYSFTNVETGTYKLIVDVPGLYMDSTYQFTVTSSNTSFTNLDFTVDTTTGSGGIYIGYPLSAKESIVINSGLRLYPNPAKENLILETKTVLNNATLTISDIMGKSVLEVNNINGKSLDLNIRNIPSGFYLWKLTENNNNFGTGKISIIK